MTAETTSVTPLDSVQTYGTDAALEAAANALLTGDGFDVYASEQYRTADEDGRNVLTFGSIAQTFGDDGLEPEYVPSMSESGWARMMVAPPLGTAAHKPSSHFRGWRVGTAGSWAGIGRSRNRHARITTMGTPRMMHLVRWIEANPDALDGLHGLYARVNRMMGVPAIVAEARAVARSQRHLGADARAKAAARKAAQRARLSALPSEPITREQANAMVAIAAVPNALVATHSTGWDSHD